MSREESPVYFMKQNNQRSKQDAKFKAKISITYRKPGATINLNQTNLTHKQIPKVDFSPP